MSTDINIRGDDVGHISVDDGTQYPYVYWDKSHRRWIATQSFSGKRVTTFKGRSHHEAYVAHCRYCINNNHPYDKGFLSIAFDKLNQGL